MIIHYNLDLSGPVGKSVITMGSFDGVHLGHRKILGKVAETAVDLGVESVLITFDIHPRKVLQQGDPPPRLLTTPDERRRIFEEIGIDHLVCLSFNEELASMEAETFIRKVFVEHLHATKIITGFGHRFGKGGKGNHDLLVRESIKYGFEAEMIPMQDIQDNMISSTLIRKLLEQEGDVAEARRYLGYAYPLTGIVTHGSHIGKGIGFPTANLLPIHPEKLIPADGVYAVKAMLNFVEYKGMMNIGIRPTINGRDKTIEVHLFGFDNEVYGEEISVTFEHRIRDERKFESLDALRAQLVKDSRQAQALLA
ncbi:MAG: bifunctional riboflavin kinase/FAD synthetase [Bacteroidales bacterium]